MVTTDIRDEVLADNEVERALIGACLISDLAIEQASALIGPDDFAFSRHKAIFFEMQRQAAVGRVDVVSLATQLPNGSLEYLHDIQNSTYTISNAARYAHTIADYRLRRDLLIASDQISMLARGTGSGDAGDAADQARALLANLDLPAGQGAPDPDVDSFVSSIDTTYDWLIPGFLEYRDRMLVTAGEGGGKSVLLTQLGFMAAAGVHPWTYEPVEPRNVTIIDLENSERLVSRRVQMLRQCIDRSKFNPQRLRIHVRPSGIDLTTRTDRRWLIDRCRANATELLVIGPAYRMSAGVAERGDTGGEDHIRKVTHALDDIRVRCNVALLMETHAPHGNGFGRDLRPFGSSVWLRWPEFGIGLRRELDYPNRYEVEHWRGARDQRVWPTHLEKQAGKWPWTPRMP